MNSRSKAISFFTLILFLILLHNTTNNTNLIKSSEPSSPSPSATATGTTADEGRGVEECYDGREDSLELQERFAEKCEWWVELVRRWKTKAGAKDAEVLEAIQERSGAGDRLMGSMTVFYHALHRGSRLNLSWSGIDQIFTPSCILSPIDTSGEDTKLINLIGERRRVSGARCVPHQTYYKCGIADHERERCPTYNRACMQSGHCQELNELLISSRTQDKDSTVATTTTTAQSPLTMAHVVGCPLNMLFGPTHRFLNADIHWFADGSERTGTVRELLSQMKSWFVIGVHARMGDDAMQGIDDRKELKQVISDTIRCNKLLQQNRASANKLPSKWLIATDSSTLRNHFIKNYPNRTLTLTIDSNHLQRSGKKKKEKEREFRMMKNLFAEWFILGRSDLLVTNVVHKFGVSSFSRSAWAYNLKSQYYELRTTKGQVCFIREYAFVGNAATISKECQKNPDLINELEQTHMTI